jgi:hypothetical protein
MTIDAVPASTCPNVFHGRAAISGGIGGRCERQPPRRHQLHRRLGVRDHHLTAGAAIRTVGCQHDVWHGPLVSFLRGPAQEGVSGTHAAAAADVDAQPDREYEAIRC